MQTTQLSSGLPVLFQYAPGTPRMALAVTFAGGRMREGVPGTAQLAGHLLLKGTAKRSAEALAQELDAHAIILQDMLLNDLSVLSAIFLNRELAHTLEIINDVLTGSTFADFEKEKMRLLGAINTSLDGPRELAGDLLGSTLFAGHPYGFTGTAVLAAAEKLDVEESRSIVTAQQFPAGMNITLVGDVDLAEVLPLLEAAFGSLTAGQPLPVFAAPVPLSKDILVKQTRPDAQQAQVFQGWHAPALGAPEQAAFSVMNTILGVGGLSSRLFRELRDKQGLAYTVRSQYNLSRLCSEFAVTIGTSPENIEKAQRGFTEQIVRMQQELVSDDELSGAKGRLRGNHVLSHETNNQHCLDYALKHIIGVGPDYGARLLEKVETVTKEQVQTAAQLLVGPSVTVIVAPE